MNWPIDGVFIGLLVMLSWFIRCRKNGRMSVFLVFVLQKRFKAVANVFDVSQNLESKLASCREYINEQAANRRSRAVGQGSPSNPSENHPTNGLYNKGWAAVQGSPVACHVDLDVCSLCSTAWRRGWTLGPGQNCCCDIENLPPPSSLGLSDV